MKIQTFKIESGKVVVSDPSHKDSYTLENVKIGTWQARVQYPEDSTFEDNIAVLITNHVDFDEQKFNCDSIGEQLDSWDYAEFDVFVDSGQAGIFDVKYYRNDDSFPNDYKLKNVFKNPDGTVDKFYGACCDATLSKQQWGTLPFGAISSSGLGDGQYPCFIHRNDKDEIDAILILFMI